MFLATICLFLIAITLVTVIWKYVVFRKGAQRRSCRRMKAFFLFILLPPPCTTITVWQLFIETNILFTSIVFRIMNFYKHVDITPSVPITFVSHPIDVPLAGAMGVQKGSRVLLRGHVSKHWALSVERVESPKICFPLIFGHMEA